MARPTIENVRQMGDFLTNFRWNVAIAPPSGLSFPFPLTDLNFLCETSEVPKMTGSSIEVTVRGHKVKQPGIYNYDNVFTLTFVETTKTQLHLFIKTWRDALWAPGTGAALLPKNKLQGTITLHQLDSQDNVVWEYILQGVYVETYDFGGLDGAASDSQKPTVSFSYDYFTDSKKP